jgi:hypothetical protein
MWHCAGYARELCDALRIAAPDHREAVLAKHIERFAAVVPIEIEQVRALLTHSVEVALKYVAASELANSDTALLAALEGFRTEQEPAAPASSGGETEQAASPRTASDAQSEQTVSLSAGDAEPMPPASERSGLTSRIAQAWRSLF